MTARQTAVVVDTSEPASSVEDSNLRYPKIELHDYEPRAFPPLVIIFVLEFVLLYFNSYSICWLINFIGLIWFDLWFYEIPYKSLILLIEGLNYSLLLCAHVLCLMLCEYYVVYGWGGWCSVCDTYQFFVYLILFYGWLALWKHLIGRLRSPSPYIGIPRASMGCFHALSYVSTCFNCAWAKYKSKWLMLFKYKSLW